MNIDISTTYMGLSLSSPVIAGSSGMTNSVANLKKLADAGAGAVVLKSLFEEEIIAEMAKTQQAMQRPGFLFPDTTDMDDLIEDESGMTTYLSLIGDAKEAVDIPVIASVNCISAKTWPSYAGMIERSGADALELNVFLMPSDTAATDAAAFERTYVEIVEAVRAEVSIPVALKVSPYFTLLARTLREFSDSGIAGLVLFNRFFNPDYDLESLEVVPTNVLSSPELLHLSLRWVAIMSGAASCEIAASTGVHDGDAVIKQLLAGAQVVQVASALYREGMNVISGMNARLREWMNARGFGDLEAFRGRMAAGRLEDPAVYD
ncbi:MAG: dihydroorotate dehydrogenase-like protein, partial [Spirochaeta sp.]|nr:dihydroorotate dehydrogenase-like protein [Spirochaeta sp.]